jgi:hypothetical protein
MDSENYSTFNPGNGVSLGAKWTPCDTTPDAEWDICGGFTQHGFIDQSLIPKQNAFGWAECGRKKIGGPYRRAGTEARRA